MSKKVILYIAMTLDGFIATKDDNIDFLKLAEKEGEDYGYLNFIKNVDTIIWGRKTYDKVLTFGGDFPYSDKKVYVLSKLRQGYDPNVEYWNNDVKELISKIKNENTLNIYCDGGSELVGELLKNQLIEKMIITIIPHLLGSGIRLFKNDLPTQNIQLLQSNSFPNGVVQLHYEIIKN